MGRGKGVVEVWRKSVSVYPTFHGVLSDGNTVPLRVELGSSPMGTWFHTAWNLVPLRLELYVSAALGCDKKKGASKYAVVTQFRCTLFVFMASGNAYCTMLMKSASVKYLANSRSEAAFFASDGLALTAFFRLDVTPDGLLVRAASTAFR